MSIYKQVAGALAYKNGVKGEHLAEGFYAKIQYIKLHSRLKTKAGEIDLIFINTTQKHLIFTEVKTTSSNTAYSDYENLISKLQWQRIFAAADIFLNEAKQSNADYADYTFSFDAVFIRNDKIAHRVKNIFAEDVL